MEEIETQEALNDIYQRQTENLLFSKEQTPALTALS